MSALSIARRQSLGLVASAVIPAATVVGTAAAASENLPMPENPALLKAYERFKAAREAVASAARDLDWLVAEWRHRWPTPAEEILGCARADCLGGSSHDEAERDIAGNYVYRNTHDLHIRMGHLKKSAKNERLCFAVVRPEWIRGIIVNWSKPVTARTPKALAKKQAEQKKVLTKYRRQLPLSESYHAEVKRIREISGVEDVKERLQQANAVLRAECLQISKAEAKTVVGIMIKAEALRADSLTAVVVKQNGILGDMARFIESVVQVIGGEGAAHG